MIRNMICKSKSSLLEVLQIINDNAKGIVFIVDENEKLCGVLTDGDIRRFLLSGGGLHENLEKILKKDFVYATDKESNQQILAKVNSKISIIPIVNSDFKVVDFFELRNDIHTPVSFPDLRGNEMKYLLDAFLSTWISSSGKYIEKFEDQFSNYCDCEYGVAVSNGTVALHLALCALGIGQGDEVIVPDLTFAATINSVLHANATPVIVDVEKDSWCIDPLEIEKAITPKTKAIIPVHLYGQPCDMDAIMNIAKKNNLYVIEDCAEAHGAKYNGIKVGAQGDIGCFSFFGNKVITTGEGGMCVTNSKTLNDKMRILRDHGMSRTKKYWHDVIGYNYRMTNLQAAIGVAQLERIDSILEDKYKIEKIYREELSPVQFIEFQSNNLVKREKITWLVSGLIKRGDRDKFITLLKEKGIDVRPFFYSLSQMDIYNKYVFSNKVSLEISKLGINFPTTFNINKNVLQEIKDAFNVGEKYVER